MRDLSTLSRLFAQHLSQQVFPSSPGNLYEPNTYFLQLGGKRLRPAMLLLGCEIYSGKAEEALDAAVAIEYFHNFTLIHDDVMDNAPSRRGHATIHNKYNINTAILSGDVLLVYAYNYVAKTPEKHRQKVWDIFNDTAVKVCEGQQLDMDFEQKDAVTEDEYLRMIEYKTSVLIAAAIQIGALIGGAGDADAERLYDFGLNLGIAFQIQDDILDCYGDTGQVGKTKGGDILQHKKTILYIKASELSLQANDAVFSYWKNAEDYNAGAHISSVMGAYDTYGVKEYAEAIRDGYMEKALEALNSLKISDDARATLRQIADQLVYRNY